MREVALLATCREVQPEARSRPVGAQEADAPMLPEARSMTPTNTGSAYQACLYFQGCTSREQRPQVLQMPSDPSVHTLTMPIDRSRARRARRARAARLRIAQLSTRIAMSVPCPGRLRGSDQVLSRPGCAG